MKDKRIIDNESTFVVRYFEERRELREDEDFRQALRLHEVKADFMPDRAKRRVTFTKLQDKKWRSAARSFVPYQKQSPRNIIVIKRVTGKIDIKVR